MGRRRSATNAPMNGQKACARSGRVYVVRTMDNRTRERLTCRRPISADEVVALEALGRELAATRRAAGYSQVALAKAVGMHPTSISRIEIGTRRTRRSTLHRIAELLIEAEANTDEVVLMERWTQLAGPALAPESKYADRVARRRDRRLRKKANRETWATFDAHRKEQHARSRAVVELSLAILRCPTDTMADLDRMEVLLDAFDRVLTGHATPDLANADRLTSRVHAE